MQVGSASFRIVPPVTERSAAGAAAGTADAAAQRAPSPLQQQQERLQEPAVRAELNALRNRDREVRAHELAHTAAGAGVVTSGPHYSYRTGPDGKRYAVGGEVGIDSSPVRGDPEATVAKARKIRAAALAPAQPSAQDLRVASKATQMEREALLEIARRERDAAAFTTDGGLPATTPPRGSLLSAIA